jgi:hypothetical protein
MTLCNELPSWFEPMQVKWQCISTCHTVMPLMMYVQNLLSRKGSDSEKIHATMMLTELAVSDTELKNY